VQLRLSKATAGNARCQHSKWSSKSSDAQQMIQAKHSDSLSVVSRLSKIAEICGFVRSKLEISKKMKIAELLERIVKFCTP